ncbi:MAG: hypothetical protein WC497_00740 [Patescibacteria group bacterium]
MRRNNVLTAIAFVSLAVLIVVELGTHYDSWDRQVALSITNIIGGGVYLLIYYFLKRRGITLPWIAAWLVALGIWFDALGNFQHFFGRILWWDKLAHFTGSLPPATVFWAVLYGFGKKGTIRLPNWLAGLFAVCLTVTLSVLYEISEYIGDLNFPTHRITDLYDTVDDLMYNLLGAVAVVIICLLIYRKKQKDDRETSV